MRHHRLRALTSAAFVVTLALGAAACSTTNGAETTGSIGAQSTASSEGDMRREVEVWGDRYGKTPTDPDVAIHYAQALRATSQRAQAVAVLERASMTSPKNTSLLGAYGRALADVGNFKQALDVLNRAHTPDQPDWRILSVQGAVLDQMGRHEDAQRHYNAALKIVPDEPSVMSNLGLSYALSKDLVRAEATLRRAIDQKTPDPRVRQNLALVVGLQGRFDEAETIARGDLSEADALANVAYLRQMLAAKSNLKKVSAAQGSLKTVANR